MGSRVKPGKFDCLKKAEPKEPIFVLLGRDLSAPRVVEAWADMRQEQLDYGHRPDTPEEREQIAEARQCAAEMRAFHAARQAEREEALKPASPEAGGEGAGESGSEAA